MYDLIVKTLTNLNELLTAGIAITAFSLLLYALSFNLRDRVARTFALIMLCVVVVYVGEALSSVTNLPDQLEFWLRLQWVGIIFLPAFYMHFSDALLATTGRPSRGRRRLAVRLVYLVSLAFLLMLPTNLLVGPLVQTTRPAPHLQRTWITWVFAAFYALTMLISWINFWRAFKRTVTSTSRRRMTYLLTGALAPALGSYPYLVFSPSFSANHQLFFWLTVTLSNLLVSVLLVLMAYAVAFFGVPWPDRIVKRRLFKWVMRGPVTASTVLAITTFVKRIGTSIGVDISAVVPTIMVASILILEHLITLIAPIWERWLFYNKDRQEIDLLQTLDERLLTRGDMQQFLESLLAAVCDRLQVSKAFVATLGAQGLEILVTIGGDKSLQEEDLSANLLRAVTQTDANGELFAWGDYWLVPLFGQSDETENLIGLLGVMRQPVQDPSSERELDREQHEALFILAQRAALAIGDRYRQQQAFSSLEELTPQMDMIQRLRAAARYDGTEILTSPNAPLEGEDLSPWVKDALSHYWGGPKLTQSPLLNLKVVQQAASQNSENPTNALRDILRKAIERVRPQGERRFTAEWILYNILEMKFMEGRKVREVAMRLAMSEADLYRKQRVAIEAVANAIIEMEQQVEEESPITVEISSQAKSLTKENNSGR
jgi:hypothetical protein